MDGLPSRKRLPASPAKDELTGYGLGGSKRVKLSPGSVPCTPPASWSNSRLGRGASLLPPLGSSGSENTVVNVPSARTPLPKASPAAGAGDAGRARPRRRSKLNATALSDADRQLAKIVLPPHYRLLADMFDGVLAVAHMQTQRGKRMSYHEDARSVQQYSGRTFELTHLRQLLTLLPDNLKLDWQASPNLPHPVLAIRVVGDTAALGSPARSLDTSVVSQLRSKLSAQLTDHLLQAYKAFLAARSGGNFPADADVRYGRWDPDFGTEDVPDIAAATLPPRPAPSAASAASPSGRTPSRGGAWAAGLSSGGDSCMSVCSPATTGGGSTPSTVLATPCTPCAGLSAPPLSSGFNGAFGRMLLHSCDSELKRAPEEGDENHSPHEGVTSSCGDTVAVRLALDEPDGDVAMDTASPVKRMRRPADDDLLGLSGDEIPQRLTSPLPGTPEAVPRASPRRSLFGSPSPAHPAPVTPSRSAAPQPPAQPSTSPESLGGGCSGWGSSGSVVGQGPAGMACTPDRAQQRGTSRLRPPLSAGGTVTPVATNVTRTTFSPAGGSHQPSTPTKPVSVGGAAAMECATPLSGSTLRPGSKCTGLLRSLSLSASARKALLRNEEKQALRAAAHEEFDSEESNAMAVLPATFDQVRALFGARKGPSCKPWSAVLDQLVQTSRLKCLTSSTEEQAACVKMLAKVAPEYLVLKPPEADVPLQVWINRRVDAQELRNRLAKLSCEHCDRQPLI